MSSFRIGVVVFAVAGSWAHGDTLFLENGDRLTGKLVELRAGVIIFETTYAGELKVQQEHVDAIETEAPWTVELRNGEIVTGPIQPSAQGVIVGGRGEGAAIESIGVIAADESGLAPPPEEPPAEKPKHWSGAVEAGASITTGETDTADASAKITAVWEKNRKKLTLSASTFYGEVESEVNTRRYFAEADFQYHIKERFYTYTATSLEHDAGRRLDLRWLIGGGFGYDLIQADNLLWSVEAGLDYQHERWNRFAPRERLDAQDAFFTQNIADIRGILSALRADLTLTPALARRIAGVSRRVAEGFPDDITEEDDISLRIAAHYEQQLFTASSVSADLVLRPEFDDFGDYRLTSDVQWATALNDRLSLRLNWLSEYDSNPGSEDAEEWDNKFITAIGYEF